MQPLVSVIVPVYNVASYLPRSIESLLQQTYRNLQIIVVDDASTDQSAEIIKRYAARDSRIVPIFKAQNAGVSAARNAGLDRATGRYLAFIDGDDWLEKESIAGLVATFEAGDYDLVVTPFFQDGVVKTTRVSRRPSGLMTRRQLVRGMLAPVGQIRGYLWNKLYRRSVVEAFHLRFDESITIMEDELFTTHYLLKANRFYYYAHATYHHVQRPGSATQSLSFVGAVPQQLATLWRIRRLLANKTDAVKAEPVKADR